jgi:hypothetical protein
MRPFPNLPKRDVPLDVMQRIYNEVKTPFKQGIVVPAPEGAVVDCPSVFRFKGRWHIVYVTTKNYVGYETLAPILPFREDGLGHPAGESCGRFCLDAFL